MKILAVDTSAKISSVCIVDENKILSEFNIDTGLTHSQTTMPMCSSALNLAGLSLEQIDAVAVSAGPGSFTGLRIGIAAVKGMCMPGNKPCVSVSTLEALCENMSFAENQVICAVMDARCSQVYNAIYLNGVRQCEDRAISIEELGNELQKYSCKIWLVGDGAQIVYNALNNRIQNLEIAPSNLVGQRASSVAKLGLKKFKQGEFISAEELNAVYLRLPQAQRQLIEKQNQK